MFTTENGAASLVLREIPHRGDAYITLQASQQPQKLLQECVSFCRMCGAERVYASGHEELDAYPLHCSVIPMALSWVDDGDPGANLFPVTEETVKRWREIYNEKMAPVDNSATLTARDEKELLSGGAYFVHECAELLGIGWMKNSELLCIATVKPGAGERVLRTLLTVADSYRVTLEVASTNAKAIRLYEKLGFFQYGEARSWYTIY